MRHLVLVLLTLGFVVTTGVVTASPAHACSCVGSTAEDQLADADLVVEAVVTAERTTGRSREYTLDVQRSWKGSQSDVVKVTTRTDEAECGRTFDDGGAQVVLAVADERGGWRTDLCRGTVLSGNRMSDLTVAQVDAQLGPGTPAGVDVIAVPDRPWPLTVFGRVVGGLLLLGLGAVIVLVLRGPGRPS